MPGQFKEDSLKKKNRITINFDKKEKDFLEKKGLYKQNLLRQIIFDTINNNKVTINTNKDPVYIANLNKIGVNINQIAKKFNSLHQISGNDITRLTNMIDVLYDLITKEDTTEEEEI